MVTMQNINNYIKFYFKPDENHERYFFIKLDAFKAWVRKFLYNYNIKETYYIDLDTSTDWQFIFYNIPIIESITIQYKDEADFIELRFITQDREIIIKNTLIASKIHELCNILFKPEVLFFSEIPDEKEEE